MYLRPHLLHYHHEHSIYFVLINLANRMYDTYLITMSQFNGCHPVGQSLAIGLKWKITARQPGHACFRTWYLLIARRCVG